MFLAIVGAVYPHHEYKRQQKLVEHLWGESWVASSPMWYTMVFLLAMAAVFWLKLHEKKVINYATVLDVVVESGGGKTTGSDWGVMLMFPPG